MAEERWSPLQGVESILRSVLLLLDEPEVSSPANVDAGVMYRTNREAFIAKAKADVEASKKDIPDGFVMPVSVAPPPPAKDFDDDDDFWNDYEDAGSGSEDDDEEGEGEFGESGDDEQEEEDEEMEDEEEE